MEEMINNLRKMGWDDRLINHFIGKGFKSIGEVPLTKLEPQSCVTSDIIITCDQQDETKYIYMK